MMIKLKKIDIETEYYTISILLSISNYYGFNSINSRYYFW